MSNGKVEESVGQFSLKIEEEMRNIFALSNKHLDKESSSTTFFSRSESVHLIFSFCRGKVVDAGVKEFDTLLNGNDLMRSFQ